MANSELVLRLWFVRGFGDAQLRNENSTFDAEGDLEKVKAWEAGHAHFHQTVNAEYDRLSSLVTAGELPGFPNYPGKPVPRCKVDSDNMPIGLYHEVIEELKSRGGKLLPGSREVDVVGMCRCQVLSFSVRVFLNHNDQTLAIVTF